MVYYNDAFIIGRTKIALEDREKGNLWLIDTIFVSLYTTVGAVS